jgi:hypothetical protein
MATESGSGKVETTFSTMRSAVSKGSPSLRNPAVSTPRCVSKASRRPWGSSL